ncbi:hypothetical protein M231_07956 [Tremella mesenterica]|uniref:Uncharacterized protein n=1 Tax=Tremella mesenterica TaxID=5217 RepID=A0A4Q1B7X1_TREME|nr:hypothetical protein M231_07956 [Tremella mesenterica]
MDISRGDYQCIVVHNQNEIAARIDTNAGTEVRQSYDRRFGNITATLLFDEGDAGEKFWVRHGPDGQERTGVGTPPPPEVDDWLLWVPEGNNGTTQDADPA